MANPAELLHDLFVSWNNDKQSAQGARLDSETLAAHRRAVRYLDGIDELLDVAQAAGKRVRTYRAYFPAWTKTVFHFPRNWTGSNTGAIKLEETRHLENLIDLLDDFVERIDPEKFEALSTYLTLVEKTLTEDESLPDSVKRSARAMITHLRGCMEDFAIVGDFDFEKALERLIGVLANVGRRSQKKDVWSKVMGQFAFPYAVNNLPSISDGVSVISKMISG